MERPLLPKLHSFFPLVTSDDVIVAMTIFNERLFVATSKGVFVKGDDDVFRPLEFEVRDRPLCDCLDGQCPIKGTLVMNAGRRCRLGTPT